MAVYVDPLRPTPKNDVRPLRWRYPEACHLFADSLEELHAFAKTLGLKRGWFHQAIVPHYDLTPNKRDQAIQAGAKETTTREYMRRIRGS
jgi:hypothetical protein